MLLLFCPSARVQQLVQHKGSLVSLANFSQPDFVLRNWEHLQCPFCFSGKTVSLQKSLFENNPKSQSEDVVDFSCCF